MAVFRNVSRDTSVLVLLFEISRCAPIPGFVASFAEVSIYSRD